MILNVMQPQLRLSLSLMLDSDVSASASLSAVATDYALSLAGAGPHNWLNLKPTFKIASVRKTSGCEARILDYFLTYTAELKLF